MVRGSPNPGARRQLIQCLLRTRGRDAPGLTLTGFAIFTIGHEPAAAGVNEPLAAEC